MAFLYDGIKGEALERRLALPRVVLLAETTSTMDDAHALAAQGAAAGTLVLAEVQTRGRGRSGGAWSAVPGSSILCTLIERADVSALEVMSLRVGLNVASALDAYASATVQLKWPNDVMIGGGKAGGILIEARWRDDAPEWVAVAIGLNVGASPADVARAVPVGVNASRLDVLAAIIPAMRRAASRRGALTEAELAEWRARDWLAGRRISSPRSGLVRGVLASGELQVETEQGLEAVRAGTVTLENV